MTLRTGPRNAHNTARRLGMAGVSLIELILVMALLATVAAIVVPQFKGFSAGRTYEGEWNRLRVVLRYARSEAVSRAVPVEVRFDAERGTYGLAGGYELGALPDEASEHVLPQGLAFQFPDDTALVNGVVTVTFWPDGTVDERSPQEIRVFEREGGFGHTLQSDPVLGYHLLTEETL